MTLISRLPRRDFKATDNLIEFLILAKLSITNYTNLFNTPRILFAIHQLPSDLSAAYNNIECDNVFDCTRHFVPSNDIPALHNQTCVRRKVIMFVSTRCYITLSVFGPKLTRVQINNKHSHSFFRVFSFTIEFRQLYCHKISPLLYSHSKTLSAFPPGHQHEVFSLFVRYCVIKQHLCRHRVHS